MNNTLGHFFLTETSLVVSGDPRDEKQNTAVGISGVGNPEDIAMLL